MEIIATETSFATHEVDEWYPGVIDRTEPGGDYGYGETFRIVMTLDGEEDETWAMSSTKLSPKSKLWGWIKGIDPALLPEFGQKLQEDKLPGKRVEVMFEQGESRENVAKIRAEKNGQAPIKGQQKRAAAAKSVPVTDGPDDSPF